AALRARPLVKNFADCAWKPCRICGGLIIRRFVNTVMEVSRNNTPPASAPVALITGGARRIGAEVARQLHEAGFNVILHCNNSIADAQAQVDTFNRQRPDSADILRADLRKLGELQALAEKAIAR